MSQELQKEYDEVIKENRELKTKVEKLEKENDLLLKIINFICKKFKEQIEYLEMEILRNYSLEDFKESLKLFKESLRNKKRRGH